MVCNLPWVLKEDLAEIWENGFVKINAIDKVDNIGAYVIKYMNKDIDDKRLQGLKAYNSSRGLTRPQELKSWTIEDVDRLREIETFLQTQSPSYATTYESEKAGKIEYSQYNLQRNDSK